MNDNQRIDQFMKMSEADPENELGHFSLGKAYLEAGRFSDAVKPLARVVELNPKLSKAYQLLGEAYDQSGRRDEAVEIVTRGVIISDGQGDRMPRDAMGEMLQRWGVPVPTFEEAKSSPAKMEMPDATTTDFRCARCGRPSGRLEKPPFKGPLAEDILNNTCSACWREWIATGTKVINELGLVLSTPEGGRTYDQYMIEFLQLEGR